MRPDLRCTGGGNIAAKLAWSRQQEQGRLIRPQNLLGESQVARGCWCLWGRRRAKPITCDDVRPIIGQRERNRCYRGADNRRGCTGTFNAADDRHCCRRPSRFTQGLACARRQLYGVLPVALLPSPLRPTAIDSFQVCSPSPRSGLHVSPCMVLPSIGHNERVVSAYKRRTRPPTWCGARFTSYAGIQRAHTARRAGVERVAGAPTTTASLCFFYSSVIKQFNITNTGLDNTSLGRMARARPPPRQPFVLVVPGPSPPPLDRARIFETEHSFFFSLIRCFFRQPGWGERLRHSILRGSLGFLFSGGLWLKGGSKREGKHGWESGGGFWKFKLRNSNRGLVMWLGVGVDY